MTPLHVALLLRDTAPVMLRERDLRWCGFFSYPVPEFTWDHIFVTADEKMDRSILTSYDLLLVEDETRCTFTGDGPPVVFLTWDGTLSRERYKEKRRQASTADLILVEHDHLEKYRCLGIPTRRVLFAVNDHLFRDYELEKAVDVSFNCRLRHRPDRVTMDAFLLEFCATAGLRYGGGFIEDPVTYAKALNQSKIVVNLTKSPYNRNFRFFDVMASRACLLSSPLPYIEGDAADQERHWRTYENTAQLTGQIVALLGHGAWQTVADAGYALMRERYTWTVRAAELRQILREELGL